MIVGAVQFKVRVLDKFEDFFSHIEDLVIDGKKQEVELLVFPEYLSVELVTLLDDWQSLEKKDMEEALKVTGMRFKDKYLKVFSEISKKYDIIISTGSIFYFNDVDKKFYNANFLVHADGKVIEQRKTHTTYELVYNRDIISKGEELKVTNVKGIPMGTLICYDAGFPENARILMKKDARVILQPGCVFDKHGVNRLKTFATARATENQLFVINSQICGDLPFPKDSPYHFEAASSIHAPVFPNFPNEYGYLAEATPNKECVISANLDFDKLNDVRDTGIPQYLKDRREDFYGRA